MSAPATGDRFDIKKVEDRVDQNNDVSTRERETFHLDTPFSYLFSKLSMCIG